MKGYVVNLRANEAAHKREIAHRRALQDRLRTGEPFTFELYEGPGTFRAVVLKGSPASINLQKKLKMRPVREVTRPAPEWLGRDWVSIPWELGEVPTWPR